MRPMFAGVKMNKIKSKTSQVEIQNKNGVVGISSSESTTRVTECSSEEVSAADKICDIRVKQSKVGDVRITPCVLQFIDAFPGKQFNEKFTIQNVGRNPVLVKIGEPSSFVFQIKKPNRRKVFLASGAKITRIITYTSNSSDFVQKSRIPICVNGETIDYHMFAKQATPDLEITPTQIDFGTINLRSEVKSLILSIINNGALRTKFEIDLGKNDLDLVVKPLRGTIKARERVKVKVELLGMEEGEFFKELWIKTSELPIRVPVLVEVLRPRLTVVYPNRTEELSAIDFPPTFCGTQKAAPFIIKNEGGEIALFVTFGDINGEYQFLSEMRKNNEIYNYFRLTAEEGRLEAFESRILTAIFCPRITKKTKGWHHQEKLERKPQAEYIVFFNLKPVHCIEKTEIENARGPRNKDDLDSNMKNNILGPPPRRMELGEISNQSGLSGNVEDYVVREGGLTLCLRGKMVKPEVLLQPSIFYFGEIELGQKDQRVLRITNKSIIRIKCVVLKTSNVIVMPDKHWIGPGKTFEFSLTVTATFGGAHRRNVKIQIIGESDVVYSTDKPLKVVAEYQVGVFFTVLNSKKVLEPKIGLGITPLLTDETGINKELVTLSNITKVPYAAKLLSFGKEFEPLWMKTKLTDVNNTMIALPNDRPRALQPWPKDKICRTIFKGLHRYSPPKDVSYTFSSQENIAKAQQNAMWTNYLLLMREIRQAFNGETTDCGESITPCYVKQFNKLLKKGLCEKSQMARIKGKESTTISWDCLVPLSPLYLSYVVVEPKLINYGEVAFNHAVSADIVINNHNIFPTTINFIPGDSAVSLDQDTIVVKPKSTKTIKIWFQLGSLGRYYGFLNYVINTSHQFTIIISALVIARSLQVESRFLTFGEWSSVKAFQPRSLFLSIKNRLQASIGYTFQFSPDSPFYSLLVEGKIPPKSTLLSEILVEHNPEKQLSAELIIISENGEKEVLKISNTIKKLDVNFLTKKIDLEDVPLNLKTKVQLIVENECYHDVAFTLVNENPMPGVTVEPVNGVIKSRSFFPLYVYIQIPVVMRFTFTIEMLVQSYHKISVKITGNVVLPHIKIKPAVIDMRKICVQSFDTVSICVENYGTTPAEVDIDFTDCPEYKILKDETHIYLRPKQSHTLVLLFEPTDVSRFVFFLPVIINSILGPPLIQYSETENVSYFLSDSASDYEYYGEIKCLKNLNLKIPLVVISCTVSSSLITVKPQIIIFQTEDMSKNPKEKSFNQLKAEDYENNDFHFPSKSLIISNDGTNTVTFCIRNDDLGKNNNSPFNLEPISPKIVEYRLKSMKATLEPGESLEFRVTFSPEKRGQYDVQVPIYIRGYNDGMVYCYITLTGKLNNPKLIPSVKEIHFCPVPLNVTSECTFSITAENYYETDTISCFICESNWKEDAVDQSLTTKWLETPEVTNLYGRQNFRMQVSFKSSKPVGLRCYLVLVDSSKNYCTVLVTAVADNSSVTTHHFLKVNAANYKLVRQDCEAPVWKADEHPVLTYPFDKSVLRRREKSERRYGGNGKKNYQVLTGKGPTLVVSRPWSVHNVGFVENIKTYDEVENTRKKDSNVISQGPSWPNTIQSGVLRSDPEKIEVTYPYYPQEEDFYKAHHDKTLHYVERWMFEVVMRCDQYFMIPTSFRILQDESLQSVKTKSKKKNHSRSQKDVIHLLAEIYDVDLVQRYNTSDGCQVTQAIRSFKSFNKVLDKLQAEDCFIPHVRAEHLLSYEEYCCYMRNVSNSDSIRMVDPESVHVMPDKFHHPLNAKAKQELDDVQNTDSNMLTEDWNSMHSDLDAFLVPSDGEAFTEKEDNRDAVDKPLVEKLSKEKTVTELKHIHELLEEQEFVLRSKQAWLDIIIQVFRHSVLKKIVYKSTIPEVQLVEADDRVPIETMESSKVSFYGSGLEPMIETYSSDLYSVQERMLLLWLNHHLSIQQKKETWFNINKDESIPADKFVNNFHNDLRDSLALISVTASYCPFVVPEYFCDCFAKPDTPDKFQHNAARLVQAWRELGIGLSVEVEDIVNPNNVFMVMLVAQLYEVLPALHPRYLVCFNAPLSSRQTKKFSAQSLSERLFAQAKILGKDSRYFELNRNFPMEMKKEKSEEIKVTFLAKKIKQMKATLLLSGFEVSSHFGKGLAIFLEGQITELPEVEKLSFSSPLYKVICAEIPINPAYSDIATYEIWYSTAKPELSDNPDYVLHSKPWSVIRFRKVCRRLFININEVIVTPEIDKFPLSVTVAVLTRKERCFWLLFRSATADFIVQLKIRPKADKVSITNLTCYYPNPWPTCLCKKTGKETSTNWTNVKSCPLITFIKVPSRNEDLWYALKTMFLKSVLPQEQDFWAEFFDKDIGLCVIQWLLSPDEEKEVIDEFVPLLQVDCKYKLSSTHTKRVLKTPSTIEIKNVREKKDILVPVHTLKSKCCKTDLTLVSENELELRRFTIHLNTETNSQKTDESEEAVILSDACRPCVTPRLSETLVTPCKKHKNYSKLY